MVRIEGRRLSRRPESERTEIRARSVGMLFQATNLIQHLTAIGNVLFAQQLVGRPNAARAGEIIERVGLTRRAGAYPSALSGGENARAGLAVALANAPKLLLTDEPTGELDGESSERMMQLLREHAESGGAVVIVTHNPVVAASADRVVRLEDGRVVA
jgi:putative ABC transport system ATP-binding protein